MLEAVKVYEVAYGLLPGLTIPAPVTVETVPLPASLAPDDTLTTLLALLIVPLICRSPVATVMAPV